MSGAKSSLVKHAILAAKRIGLPQLPAVRLKHLSAAQKRAFAIADNRLGELAEWDFEILSEELSFLFSADEQITFDARIAGFDTPEADQIILGQGDADQEAGSGRSEDSPPRRHERHSCWRHLDLRQTQALLRRCHAC